VLISLCSVDDKATGELVRAFYQAWLGPSHPTKAEALRSAQAAVRETHPDARHWAAFQLVGR
jgi:CHAT domain-containing protein